ncbi:inositol monophosphatase family protein [Oscillospiraceae bacterium MB08-C2-2]|nr:inositol monophosphatase family protein [Oscillospiraceae bacterium MB08-C2-2]
MNLEKLHQEVIRLVLEAGRLAKEKSVTGIKAKGAFDFVTQTDQMVDALLRKELAELLPGSHFVTEENDDRDYSYVEPTWVVDPIDGTSNLIFGMNQSAVSVALLVEGVPTSGVVYNPFTDELFTALRGAGAYLNGEPIHVSGHRTMGETLIGVGTNPYNKENTAVTFAIIEAVFRDCVDIRRMGAGALDICLVACGRLGGFFEKNLKPWDIAAGMVILLEAGGVCVGWDGKPLALTGPEDVLCSNGFLQETLMGYISRKG